MIGVVGADGTGGLADRLRSAGRTVEVGAADRVVERGPEAVVAVGEAALVDLVRAGVDTPVLPVGDISGVTAVERDAVPSAVERLRAGDSGTEDRRVLSVTVAGEWVGRAAFDVMLVRAEPGRISEYRLEAAATRARFRADGVVVATPAGSHGYAGAAGGPRLAPDAAAVAVVPVAAFGLGAPTWVVDPAPGLRLSVERDEGAVSVLVDGREERRLPGRAAIELGVGGTLRLVVPDDP